MDEVSQLSDRELRTILRRAGRKPPPQPRRTGNAKRDPLHHLAIAIGFMPAEAQARITEALDIGDPLPYTATWADLVACVNPRVPKAQRDEAAKPVLDRVMAAEAAVQDRLQ